MAFPFEPAAAFEGRYSIPDALDADGTKYTGEVLFEANGLFARVTGSLSTGETRYGLAALFDNRLLIAWGPIDKVEIGAYQISGDQMTGVWVPPGAKGEDLSICGVELSRQVLPGEWEIEKAHAIDHQPYTGRVMIAEPSPSTPPQYQPVQVTWKLHDGDYHAFGLKLDAFMVTTFSFEPDARHGISVYTATPSGWEGTQLWKDELRPVREQLKRA